VTRLAHRSTRGFSLVEALIAAGLVSTVIVSLGRLVIVATTANRTARAATLATLIAVEKVEQLHGLLWAVDPSGVSIADTVSDLAMMPDQPGGGGLSLSPSGALQQNVNGFCDFFDSDGRALGGGPAPPPGTYYVRRWSIEPLEASPDRTLLLRVLVTEWRGQLPQSSGARLPGDVRFVSIKTRKAV